MNQNLLGPSWYPRLKEEIEKPYFQELTKTLRQEYSQHKIYPKPDEIFKALQLAPFESVKVVMISQDPYPFGQADGLAFSTTWEDTPFSLRMIFRELDRDVIRTKDYREYKNAFPTNSLINWAKEGVLLLNRVLTVRAEHTNSHKELGWQQFTNRVIRMLAEDKSPKAFVLWGAEARKGFIEAIQGVVVDTDHLVLESGHPASGSHGKDKYSGNGHFSKINHWLKKQSVTPIRWDLTNTK